MRILIIFLLSCSLITACSQPDNEIFESDTAASDEAKAEKEAAKIAKKIAESREQYKEMRRLLNTLTEHERVSLTFAYRLTTHPNETKKKYWSDIKIIKDSDFFLTFKLDESFQATDKVKDKLTQDFLQQAISIIDLQALNPNPFQYFKMIIEKESNESDKQTVKLQIEFDGTNLNFEYKSQSGDSLFSAEGYESRSVNSTIYYKLIIEQDN